MCMYISSIGTVSQLFDMMDFLEAHTPGFHRGSVADTGDDLAVHRALQMYACSRPWDVDVDREGRFFGPVGIPREVAAAPPMSKASLESGLFAELDDAALESIRYCDLNYAAERLGPLIACNSPSECYVNMTEAQVLLIVCLSFHILSHDAILLWRSLISLGNGTTAF